MRAITEYLAALDAALAEGAQGFDPRQEVFALATRHCLRHLPWLPSRAGRGAECVLDTAAFRDLYWAVRNRASDKAAVQAHMTDYRRAALGLPLGSSRTGSTEAVRHLVAITLAVLREKQEEIDALFAEERERELAAEA